MSEGNTNPPDASEEELRRLTAMPDDEIDTFDIPEIKDWRGAKRGKFYHPDANNTFCCISTGILWSFLLSAR